MHGGMKTLYFDDTCLRCQLRKPTMEQNAFHMTCVSPILKFDPKDYIYSKAVMSASDYNDTAYSE